jgi:hypothetical protein
MDDQPATLVIIGQVVTEKLAVEPLGNFQARQQRENDVSSFRQGSDLKCSNAKLVVMLKRPAAAVWRADFETAIKRLSNLQDAVAKNKAERLWLIDNTQKPALLRFSFSLWEAKVTISSSTIRIHLTLLLEIW